MSDTLPEVRQFLEQSSHAYEVLACDPDLADTAVFCETYGISLEDSANAIVVKSKAKTGDPKFACCVLLATHRLNVNQVVRKKLEARRVSFASAEETRELTGMEIGGVTPLALPDGLPVWIDGAVTGREFVIIGGGNRSSKLKVAPQLLLEIANAELVEGLANRVEPAP